MSLFSQRSFEFLFYDVMKLLHAVYDHAIDMIKGEKGLDGGCFDAEFFAQSPFSN